MTLYDERRGARGREERKDWAEGNLKEGRDVTTEQRIRETRKESQKCTERRRRMIYRRRLRPDLSTRRLVTFSGSIALSSNTVSDLSSTASD